MRIMSEDLVDVESVKTNFTNTRPDSVEARSKNETAEDEPKIGEILFFTEWQAALIGDSDVVHQKLLGFLTTPFRKEEDDIYGGENSLAGLNVIADVNVDFNIWVPATLRSQKFLLTENGGRRQRYKTTIPSDEDLEEVFRSIKSREEKGNKGEQSYLQILRDRVQNRNIDEDLKPLLDADAVRITRALDKVLS